MTVINQIVVLTNIFYLGLCVTHHWFLFSTCQIFLKMIFCFIACPPQMPAMMPQQQQQPYCPPVGMGGFGGLSSYGGRFSHWNLPNTDYMIVSVFHLGFGQGSQQFGGLGGYGGFSSKHQTLVFFFSISITCFYHIRYGCQSFWRPRWIWRI